MVPRRAGPGAGRGREPHGRDPDVRREVGGDMHANTDLTAGLVRGDNTSLAWLAALEYLLARGGKAVNLMVVIDKPYEEHAGIRARLDQFVAARRSSMPQVRTVANTIFPSALYLPRLGEGAREHLYENHRFGQPV